MKTCNSSNRWVRWMAAAGGVLTLSAGAHGGGQPEANLAAQIDQNLTIGRVVNVEIPQVVRDVPSKLSEEFPNANPNVFETTPVGVPVVTFEIPNNEAVEAGLVDSRGIAATGGTGETYVFYQPNDSGFGHFVKDDDALGYGTWSSQAILGNGFEAGMTISGYNFLMYNSAFSVNDGAWSAELWDGDPFAALDTVCNGGNPAPIAGTAASWGPLAQAPPDSTCEAIFGDGDPNCVGLYRLKATLGSKVVIPCDRVWIVVTMTAGCRSGWRISGTAGNTYDAPAYIGFQNAFEFFYGCEIYEVCGPNQDTYGAGTCCNSGAACDFTDPDPANWSGAPCSFEPQDVYTSPADPTFCGSGTIDFVSATGNNPDEYRGYVSSVFAPTDIAMGWYPKRATSKGGKPHTSTVNGNEISISVGGVNVELELQVNDWSGDGVCTAGVCVDGPFDGDDCPDGDIDCATRLKAFGAALDIRGYSNGLGGALTEKLISCTEDVECTKAFGGACSVFGNPCTQSDQCQLPSETCNGSRCARSPARLGAYCYPAYAATKRLDFALVHTNPIGSVDVSTPQYRFGFVAQGGASEAFADLDVTAKNGLAYMSTLWVHLPDNAKGSYSVGLFPAPSTVLVDQDALFIPLIGMTPATITVSTGSCCSGIGSNDKKQICIDTLTENQCTDHAGICKGFCVLDPTGLPCAGDSVCDARNPGDTCQGGETLGLPCLVDAADGAAKGLTCDESHDEICVGPQGGTKWTKDGSCSAGCVECLAAADCADSNACTVDSCDAGVCVNAKVAAGHSATCNGGSANGRPCADDSECPGDSKKDAYCQTTECCDPNTTKGTDDDIDGEGAVTQTDDGDQCTRDYCDKGPGRGAAAHDIQADGWQCDDGDCKTDQDVCAAGACAGGDIAGRTCNDETECENKDNPVACFDPIVSCDLVSKTCVEGEPQFEFDVHLSGKPHFCAVGGNPCTSQDDCTLLDLSTGKTEICELAAGGDCFAQGEKITIDVIFTGAQIATGLVINGGQFVVEYDPGCVDFNNIVPGGFPYTWEIEEIVDEAVGRIFYAVGVDPFGGRGNLGGALATMSFTKLGNGCSNCVLDFGGQNPMNTYLVDSEGQAVKLPAHSSIELHVNDQLSVNVPEDSKHQSDCDASTAIVTWDAPTASTSCGDPACDPKKEKCYGVNLNCWGTHLDSGLDMTHLAMGGGEHPQGTTQYFCTATSKICGDDVTDDWTVTVNETQSLDVEIQLSPVIAGDIVRCINFELFSDCVDAPVSFQTELLFGGLFDFVGHFTEVKKIPKGQYVCLTARDQQHTLRSCDFVECIDGVYHAVMKGDPFFGGNWLTGGNLDGWKKANPQASVDVIDILDFGQFVASYMLQLNPNTICEEKHDGPHADINGDGIVDAADFSFVSMNFLDSSKDCCCPGSTAGVVGRTEVSVRELRQMGMNDLTIADLNGDGLVNLDDMSAFLAGEVPSRKSPLRSRSDSSVGSGR